jgi:hypothetical protein
MFTFLSKLSRAKLPLRVENHDEIKFIRQLRDAGLIEAAIMDRSKGRYTYGEEILAIVRVITPNGKLLLQIQ